jgi:hypothetical protein
MRREAIMTSVGGVALLPALLLVSAGLADKNVPRLLTNPVLVMGGLLVALLTSLLVATRWELRKEPDGIRLSCTIRYRVATLVVLATGLGLLAIITLYLFVENFQPRLLG